MIQSCPSSAPLPSPRRSLTVIVSVALLFGTSGCDKEKRNGDANQRPTPAENDSVAEEPPRDTVAESGATSRC